ncbi:MAG: SH3 domain-containing protein [Oscillospiraceae bacterium]|nr:SH3 domain-containing protein [Oscillospiraceae bacterium]
MLLVGGIIVFIATRKPADQEPPAASAPATSTEAPVQATASPAQEDKIISSGYIDAGSNAYATIYEAADTSSSTLARAYTGDTVDIYSIENNWYRVKFGSVTGYLPAEFVTFSEPVKETAPPAAEKPAEQPTQAPTQPVQKPTCSANIIVDTSGGGDGGTFYLNVSGSYAYYVYSARAYYSSGDYEDLGQFKSSDSKVRLTAGSVFSYVTANVTPYSIDDTAGDAVSCRGDMPVSQPKPQSANVTPCNMYGFINTHGYKICSFTTDYVVNNGKEAYVRESLGHDWSVKAVNYCYSYGVEWYELYDADDGDYYGWVDANYIDFGG